MAIPPLVWLGGALAAAWLGLRKLRRYLPSHEDRQAKIGTETVRCAHCGVFVPRTLAVERQGRWYCGTEHAQRPPRS
jgi:uncharacterized protein